MAVIGPNYSEEQADKATEEILEFLKQKYSIQDHDPILFKDKCEKFRKEANDYLRKAIHKLFEYQSWEDF